uniref:Ig-like domain-containing protein n=1 Tax=Astyanax mexicanus TaxID=7994 RepID=A0A8B9GPQ0_ASTMX
MPLRSQSEAVSHCLTSSDHAKPAPIQVVNLGDSVTIQCHLPQKRITTMVWYKQSVGQNPRPLAMVYNYVRETKFEDEFQNGRFNVYPEKGSFHLNIAAVGQEDTGAYYCGIVFLNELQLVEENINFVQQPVLELVHPGHSISLECTVFTKTCSEDHSVYWFRHAAGESHPGIIVTHGDSSSPCTRSSETVSPTQSCIYKLPKNNLTACGEILFGNGTALKLMGKYCITSLTTVLIVWKFTVLFFSINICSLFLLFTTL